MASKQEIAKCILAIRTQCEDAMPSAGSKDGLDILIALWWDVYKDVDIAVLWTAVKNAILHCKYSKQNWLSAVDDEFNTMLRASEPTDNGLWGQLMDTAQAYKNALYYTGIDNMRAWANAKRGELWSDLPKEVREYLGSEGELVRLCKASADDLSYEKARFVKAIGEVRQKVRVMATMPMAVQTALAQANRLLIGDGINGNH